MIAKYGIVAFLVHLTLFFFLLESLCQGPVFLINLLSIVTDVLLQLHWPRRLQIADTALGKNLQIFFFSACNTFANQPFCCHSQRERGLEKPRHGVLMCLETTCFLKQSPKKHLDQMLTRPVSYRNVWTEYSPSGCIGLRPFDTFWTDVKATIVCV